eukprot:CAMPEP_0174921268 /NCGR_PEP_ID=MMETSP1355-20121228/5038_1 /TAXON_ID=464990 /ORGANISM="Hemiselmis tepida, Strain CCMP443" /LENGTH=190 /DNA_ID=CAMNT_0016166733 /DNA_START=19 /DNA_END=588 /DNA_ORIENTATION=-
MARLQPLPKKQPAASGGASGGISHAAASVPPGGKALIQPRRMALKYDTSTLVIEYKEMVTGKLRHRSFHIDTNRFGSTDVCVDKLDRKLKRVVVPGSIQTDQLRRLVSKLFLNKKDSSSEDLDAATDAFLNRQPPPLPETSAVPVESPVKTDAIRTSSSERKILVALPRKSPPPKMDFPPAQSEQQPPKG